MNQTVIVICNEPEAQQVFQSALAKAGLTALFVKPSEPENEILPKIILADDTPKLVLVDARIMHHPAVKAAARLCKMSCESITELDVFPSPEAIAMVIDPWINPRR